MKQTFIKLKRGIAKRRRKIDWKFLVLLLWRFIEWLLNYFE